MDEEDAAPSAPGVPFDRLPIEIQSQIADYLDTQSLFNAILVNKEWFLRLIDLLWHTVSLHVLSTDDTFLRTMSRRQYYAAKIRSALIDSDSRSCHNLLEGLKLHSIQRLDIRGVNAADDSWLSSLLMPTLQFLHLNTPCDMNKRVLDLLWGCTQLRELSLRRLKQPHSEAEFLAYLSEAPSLRTVVFQRSRQYVNDKSSDGKILGELLRRGDLECLTFCMEMARDCFGEPLSSSVISFPVNANLRSLHVEGHASPIITCLSTATDRLDRLELVLLDFRHHVFRYLRNFSGLSSLYVYFELGRTAVSTRYPVSNLDLLCTLTKLTCLHIGTECEGGLNLEWMTDAYFASWIAHFGQLRRLELVWKCKLTSTALLSIARSCPRLSHCTIGWKVNLQAWTCLLTAAPLLARLESLRLDEIVSVRDDR